MSRTPKRSLSADRGIELKGSILVECIILIFTIDDFILKMFDSISDFDIILIYTVHYVCHCWDALKQLNKIDILTSVLGSTSPEGHRLKPVNYYGPSIIRSIENCILTKYLWAKVLLALNTLSKRFISSSSKWYQSKFLIKKWVF